MASLWTDSILKSQYIYNLTIPANFNLNCFRHGWHKLRGVSAVPSFSFKLKTFSSVLCVCVFPSDWTTYLRRCQLLCYVELNNKFNLSRERKNYHWAKSLVKGQKLKVGILWPWPLTEDLYKWCVLYQCSKFWINLT